ncbi:MAG: transglutaminase-like domain-containing protein [Candidatus Nanoarchaeia archaeon]|nr:transglutaminase-like domain-containing protein [Candidatus Nanoarchaeia archaeon]
MFLFILPVVYAQEDYGAYSYLDLNYKLESNLVVSASDAEFVKAEISFFPKTDERQTVESIKLISEGDTFVNEYASFYWSYPSIGVHEFGIDSRVKVKNVFYPIKNKVDFPVRNLGDNIDYTEPTEFVDITPEIEEQAREIIKGEDDLFVAVYEVAEWTKINIEYNLSTLTAEVVQKSSWVLENRNGVCDELTNLFISMLRSVGIPARFVSGMVYTNKDDTFGNHGWAEVYFPGFGWVPYDVTFGQYGWIDPSHIKLKEDKDSGKPSAEYTWRSNNGNVKLNSLDTKVIVLNKGALVESPLEISAAAIEKNVGFGSYVPLEVNVKNKLNSYFIANLYVTKAPGLTGENSKRIILKPNEEKVAHWIVKVPDDLDENYVYTALLAVEDDFGGYSESNLKYSKKDDLFSKERAEAIVGSYLDKSEKKLSSAVGLVCKFGKEYYYSNETADLKCVVKNLALSSKKIEVCYRFDCFDVSLEVGGLENVNFLVDASVGGRVIVSADSDDGVKYDYVNLPVVRLPEVLLTNFKPETIHYYEDASVSFTLSTGTPVFDVEIDTGYGKFKLPDFSRETEVKYGLPARALVEGAKLKISYLDEKGAFYEQNLAFHVNVLEIPWYVRFWIWFKGLF